MLLSLEELQNKKFEKAKMFGYKAEDVDGFFSNFLESYKELYKEKRDLENKINFLADKLTEYREQENKLSEILIEAKKVSDNMTRKARVQADTILAEAKSTVDNMIADGKKKVDQQQYIFTKLQREVSLFKTKVLSMYKSHVDVISSLPEVDINIDFNNSQDLDKVKIDSEIQTRIGDITVEESSDFDAKKDNSKEKTMTISLDGKKNLISDLKYNTKSIVVPNDIKDAYDRKKINNDKNSDKIGTKNDENKIPANSKFGEPLKFGSAYNIKSDRGSKSRKY